MKTTKRLISVILSLVMVIGMATTCAGAFEKVSSESFVPIMIYWGNGNVKGVQLAITDERFTKMNSDKVFKVYYYPEGDVEKGSDVWDNIPLALMTKKIEYVGEVSAKDSYYGTKDFRSRMMYPLYDSMDTLHINLSDLNLTKTEGEYCVVIEEGTLSNDDGSLVNETIYYSGIIYFKDQMTLEMKLGYLIILLFGTLTMDIITKGF